MNSREDFFRAFRVLKPGGKLFMADFVTLKAPPGSELPSADHFEDRSKVMGDSAH